MKRELWDQRAGEGGKAYEAFCVYRDMGLKERAIRKAAVKLGKDHSLLLRWSTKNGWIVRAEAYDEHLDQEARRKLRLGIGKMAEQHTAVATAIMAKVAERVLQLTTADLKDAETLVKVMRVAVDVERLSRGEATDRHESKQDVKHSGEVAVTGDDQMGEDLRDPQMMLLYDQLEARRAELARAKPAESAVARDTGGDS